MKCSLRLIGVFLMASTLSTLGCAFNDMMVLERPSIMFEMSDSISVTTNKAEYAQGENVILTIRNDSPIPIEIVDESTITNDYSGTVFQKNEMHIWKIVPPYQNCMRMYIMRKTLRNGECHEYEFQPHLERMTTGIYKVRINAISINEDDVSCMVEPVYSNEFRIR